MAQRSKITKKTKQQRINYVMDLLGSGMMTWQIVDKCMNEWCVNERSVKRYLTHVYTFLTESLKEKDKDKILLEYEKLIYKYESMGDSKMAYMYRVHRDKILGLLVNKTDITSGGEKMTTIIYVEKP